MNKFCRCGSVLHPVRIELGYNKCVQCSDVQQVSYVPIIEHKLVIVFKSYHKN